MNRAGPSADVDDAATPEHGVPERPLAPPPSRRAPPLRLASRLGRAASRRRADVVACLVLVLVPLALYTPFSLAGHPVMPGDDLYQNFPLRVLAGRLLASGHLPLWDPFIWSGTPLLAGWNAGALFPGTWLFAIMPPVAAWTCNLALAPAIAGTGAYALARRLSCGPFASLAAALVFSYTGFMSGQIVHLGLAQGCAFMPWVLLGIELLARRPAGGELAGPVALVALASALSVLAGDPRAPTTTAIAAVCLLLAWLLRAPAATLRRTLPPLAGALAIGAALSALQWLPGLKFVANSQRGVGASSLFSAGSVSLAHLGTLLLVPFLNGTNTNFGLVVYQGSVNLQELTVGAGLVALAAAGAYLPLVARSAGSWLRRMLRPSAGDRGPLGVAAGGGARSLGVWYVIAALGVVLSEGSNTRLGGALSHLPLYGGERLQNRNAALIDLALTVLLAFFVDDLAGRGASRPESWLPLRTWASRLLALLSPAGVVVIGIAAWVAPLTLERGIEMPVPDQKSLFHQLAPYLDGLVAVAVLLAAFLVVASRLPPRWRTGTLGGLVLVDVLSYALMATYAAPPVSRYSAATPQARAVAAATGSNGRNAFYDPLFSFPPTGMQEPDTLGVPDLNILQHSASVEGYGSVVGSAYQNATSTHGVEYLAPSELDGPLFSALDLHALLTLPVYIWQQLPSHAPLTLPGQPVPAGGVKLPPSAAGPFPLAPGQSETFVLGERSSLVRASAILEGEAAPGSTLRIGEAGADRLVAHTVAIRNGVAVAGLPPGDVAGGVRIENTSAAPVVIAAVTVVTRNPDLRWDLDGNLQGDLAPPQWRYSGTIGNFLVYRNTRSTGFAWLQPAGSRAPRPAERLRGGSVRAAPATATQIATTVKVDAPRPATLVRSVAYSAGWSATLVPAGHGPPRTEPVRAFGLVQAVHLPAGRYTVTFRYSPPSVRDALAAAAAGALALVALGAGAFWWRRRPTRVIPA